MFIDMVDSTKFKTVNYNAPEKWILRVRQFSEIVAEYIEECGGRVVKYIGDELMATFNRKSKIYDAENLLSRLKELQKDISEITGEETKVKIALDFGNVFYLKYKGHLETDPQGIPVDRCARIAKYCKPEVILTTLDFVKKTDHSSHWSEIGELDIKGIGLTKVFQFGEATTNLTPSVISNPYYAMDLKAIENDWKLFSVLMVPKTIIIITGCHIFAELLDRAAAEILRSEIDKRGNYKSGKRAIIIGDMQWNSNVDPIHSDCDEFNEQFCPTISIGGRSMNSLTGYIIDNAQEKVDEGNVGFAKMTSQNKVHIALWGYSASDTRKSVENFISSRLESFLNEVW